MVIIETGIFTRIIQALMDDDSYADLQTALVHKPDLGDLITGGGEPYPDEPYPDSHRKSQ